MDNRARLVFSLEEAAEMLGISRAKAYELVKEKLIPHRKIPGVAGVKFTQGDIDQILADALRTPAAVA